MSDEQRDYRRRYRRMQERVDRWVIAGCLLIFLIVLSVLIVAAAHFAGM